MPDEYISREAALKDFEACNAENPRWTPQRVKTLLLRQPAADVAEVVRCKDCIYRINGRCFSRTSFINSPAVEPDDVAALTRCIDHVVDQLQD